MWSGLQGFKSQKQEVKINWQTFFILYSVRTLIIDKSVARESKKLNTYDQLYHLATKSLFRHLHYRQHDSSGWFLKVHLLFSLNNKERTISIDITSKSLMYLTDFFFYDNLSKGLTKSIVWIQRLVQLGSRNFHQLTSIYDFICKDWIEHLCEFTIRIFQKGYEAKSTWAHIHFFPQWRGSFLEPFLCIIYGREEILFYLFIFLQKWTKYLNLSSKKHLIKATITATKLFFISINSVSTKFSTIYTLFFNKSMVFFFAQPQYT